MTSPLSEHFQRWREATREEFSVRVLRMKIYNFTIRREERLTRCAFHSLSFSVQEQKLQEVTAVEQREKNMKMKVFKTLMMQSICLQEFSSRLTNVYRDMLQRAHFNALQKYTILVEAKEGRSIDRIQQVRKHFSLRQWRQGNHKRKQQQLVRKLEDEKAKNLMQQRERIEQSYMPCETCNSPRKAQSPPKTKSPIKVERRDAQGQLSKELGLRTEGGFEFNRKYVAIKELALPTFPAFLPVTPKPIIPVETQAPIKTISVNLFPPDQTIPPQVPAPVQGGGLIRQSDLRTSLAYVAVGQMAAVSILGDLLKGRTGAIRQQMGLGIEKALGRARQHLVALNHL